MIILFLNTYIHIRKTHMNMNIKREMGRAISHIMANSNCSMGCAKNLLVKQALRVISNERKKSEAVRVLFYTRFQFHPRWQYRVLTDQINTLMRATRPAESLSIGGI